MTTPTLLRKATFSWLSWQNVLSLLLLFAGLVTSRSALGQAYNFDNITIRASPAGGAATTTSYDGTLDPNGTNDAFDGQDLGKGSLFDQTTGTLSITRASSNLSTSTSVAQNITASSIFYRVYLSGTPVANQPAYSQLSFALTSASNTGNPVTYALNGTTVDLLNQPAVLGGGTYIVEIVYQSTYTQTVRGVVSQPKNIVDPGNVGGVGYQATFRVIAPLVTPIGGTTIWQSTTSTDWAVAANWSNGVPTATSNAVIPAKTTGSGIVYPILNSPTTTYAVKNLTLVGTLNSSRAQLSIGTATLTIYGDLNQPASGLTGSTTGVTGTTDATQNSTIVFAGADQVITGTLVASDVIIAGSGTKSVVNVLNPTNIILFRPQSTTAGVIVQSASLDNSNGTVQPVFDTTLNTYISLGSTGIISTVPGQGETNVSYIKGVSRVNRNLTSGQSEPFGNIGLDMTANHDVTSGILVYRVVGDALTGPTGTTAVPIKRQYQILGDDNSNAPAYASSSATIVFHYLASADELNGISENNLTMFRTTTGGTPYTPVNGVLNTTTHTITRENLLSLASYTLTLGDKTNPLPVTLVSFTATRSATNALLVWSTANEQNNKGFEVQVSTDGTTFRTLAFVASQGANSTQKLDYRYTDTETNKVGNRYYRLHQIDLDGHDSYSPVQIVNFDGAAVVASALSVYPNPIISDEAHMLVQTAEVGTAHLRISDLMGRVITDQVFTTASGTNEVSLAQFAGAKTGTYLAQLTLPSGQVKTVRIQKQ